MVGVAHFFGNARRAQTQAHDRIVHGALKIRIGLSAPNHAPLRGLLGADSLTQQGRGLGTGPTHQAWHFPSRAQIGDQAQSRCKCHHKRSTVVGNDHIASQGQADPRTGTHAVHSRQSWKRAIVQGLDHRVEILGHQVRLPHPQRFAINAGHLVHVQLPARAKAAPLSGDHQGPHVAAHRQVAQVLQQGLNRPQAQAVERGWTVEGQGGDALAHGQQNVFAHEFLQCSGVQGLFANL